ncbi:MAG: protein of unknown function DUF1814 [uncultured bacterium]|nr:MAG: protein of unknown function DUF1814 [uncultured bacterium]OFW69132.1 MAG: hypothetical protein A2X70_07410 [Alphaproteobacteria bacterium GWC2_42_16]OFW73984.1 MAG: hypothetical protein A2Z80_04480 [Alphaproteobacteria bacterium GWA2_41_27]OFW82536.1 MAG: hypothetical protein A3E50_02920 [Alphaproteobacteria bacterium RIFCSPHIGHO2_12_FULL_42_100]OFW85817.1 MAG: hypothetical protein A2W06_02665 [Alphaproteobacteria bacterium RBG_16_42_14]OFW90627.1 MAG: hypothetical protein A2W46_07720 
MKPNLSVLPKSQKGLFVELKDTPSHFVLYGGTAIALRLGHRVSVDFDFFTHQSFDPDTLYQKIPYLKNSEILQKEENTLTCLVNRQGPIKVSFFGNISLKRICKPEIIDGPNIKIASLLDLAGMKAAVIQKRAASRDYIDIEALIMKAGIDLLTALAAGFVIYGNQFNPQITLKALVYFKGGDLKSLPQKVKNNLLKAIQTVALEEIPTRIIELQEMQKKKQC